MSQGATTDQRRWFSGGRDDPPGIPLVEEAAAQSLAEVRDASIDTMTLLRRCVSASAPLRAPVRTKDAATTPGALDRGLGCLHRLGRPTTLVRMSPIDRLS